MSIQSPIEIDHKMIKFEDNTESLVYHGYWDSTARNICFAKIENNGTTAIITLNNHQMDRQILPYISGSILRNHYIFEQLHFHWSKTDSYGCEHLLEGMHYSMEAHFVHYNSKYKNFTEAKNKHDGLCVIAFFLQAIDNHNFSNKNFEPISNAIQKIQKLNSSILISSDIFSWIGLQELHRHYYLYRGSLTSPPYSENVIWIIYRTPIYVSKKQVSVFRELQSSHQNDKTITKNNRNIQKPHKNIEVVFVRNVRNKFKSKL